MLSFKERLELLEHDLVSVPPSFVMSEDLPFAIFRYDPSLPAESEWTVRREVRLLGTRVGNASGKTVHTVSLAELYWQSIQESEGIDAVAELERQSGFLAAQDQVNCYLTDADWRPLTDLLQQRLSGLDPQSDIAFLIRAAVFAPASYRVSVLLEQMYRRVRVPVVLFYPGKWTGSLNYLGLRSAEDPLGSYRLKIYGRE